MYNTLIKFIKNMKINFEQIFNPSPNKNNHQQLDSTRPVNQQSFIANTNRSREFNVFDKYDKRYNSSLTKVQNVLKATNTEGEIYRYQWYRSSSLEDLELINPENLGRDQKFNKKINIESLTQRLNTPSQCRKNKCIQGCNYEKARIMEKQILPLKGPKANKNRTLTQISEKIKKNHSQYHEKMYRKHYHLTFKKQLAHQQQMTKNSHHPSIKQSPYNKNYTNFYNRLDQIVQKKHIKQQYCSQNIQKINPTTTFQPNCYASHKSYYTTRRPPMISPRSTKKSVNRMQHILNKSLQKINQVNTSLDRDRNYLINSHVLMDRNSQKIVQKDTNKIIDRLCGMFGVDGYFELQASMVEQLSEQEFDVIFPLLSQLEEEEEKITLEEFRQRINEFYQILPTCDKQILRTQRKKVNSKYHNSTHLDLKNMIFYHKNQYKTGKSKINKKKQGKKQDYLLKLSSFI